MGLPWTYSDIFDLVSLSWNGSVSVFKGCFLASSNFSICGVSKPDCSHYYSKKPSINLSKFLRFYYILFGFSVTAIKLYENYCWKLLIKGFSFQTKRFLDRQNMDQPYIIYLRPCLIYMTGLGSGLGWILLKFFRPCNL